MIEAYAAAPQRKTVQPVIDCDIHEAFRSIKDLVPYLGEPWKGLMAQGAFPGFAQPFVYWGTGGGNRADSYPEGGPAGSDLGLLRAQVLDAYPIHSAVLTGYFYPAMLRLQFAFASALASAYNDYQVHEWLDKDERLLGSIHVAPQDPKSAVREIERMADHPRMVQVLLPLVERPYGDDLYEPIFAAAVKHDLIVATHHTVHTVGALGMGRYYIERHMLIPQATMATLYSLICGGVFSRHPNLRLLCLEGGFTWLPHVMWRADREYRSLHQEVPWLKQLPSEILRDQVRFSTQPAEDLTARELTLLVELMGSEELLVFSTDYPHFDFDSPERSLPSGLPQDLLRKILFDNARSFYDL